MLAVPAGTQTRMSAKSSGLYCRDLLVTGTKMSVPGPSVTNTLKNIL